MCYCSIDDGPSVYWEHWPIAKKQHVCCECGSTIDPGEKYYLLKGIWEGDFETYKQCRICKNVWDEAISVIECICFGELWETVGSEFEYAALSNPAMQPT